MQTRVGLKFGPVPKIEHLFFDEIGYGLNAIENITFKFK